jgi:3-oxoacyl-(acyl-carrier-protein) synthase
LDYIKAKPRDIKAEWAITNFLGFGGNNACLVLKSYNHLQYRLGKIVDVPI